jgi:hypothetical protein
MWLTGNTPGKVIEKKVSIFILWTGADVKTEFVDTYLKFKKSLQNSHM